MFDVVRVECEVTCPCCGHVEWMPMEPDQSPFVLVCDQCRDVSAPPPGECCLFCAFGSCQCLPRQAMCTHSAVSSQTNLSRQGES